MSAADYVEKSLKVAQAIAKERMQNLVPNRLKLGGGGKAGGPASIAVTGVQAFLVPILADLGYDPAQAALVSDQIRKKMMGPGGSIVFTSGRDWLFDNGHYEVVDRNNIVVAAIDKKTHFIVPEDWVLDLFDPRNDWLDPEKGKKKAPEGPQFSKHDFTPPPLQSWPCGLGPPPKNWDGLMSRCG